MNLRVIEKKRLVNPPIVKSSGVKREGRRKNNNNNKNGSYSVFRRCDPFFFLSCLNSQSTRVNRKMRRGISFEALLQSAVIIVTLSRTSEIRL